MVVEIEQLPFPAFLVFCFVSSKALTKILSHAIIKLYI